MKYGLTVCPHCSHTTQRETTDLIIERCEWCSGELPRLTYGGTGITQTTIELAAKYEDEVKAAMRASIKLRE